MTLLVMDKKSLSYRYLTRKVATPESPDRTLALTPLYVDRCGVVGVNVRAACARAGVLCECVTLSQGVEDILADRSCYACYGPLSPWLRHGRVLLD
jgi:hypothetical protein